MLQYHTIANDSDNIRLEALIVNGEYVMPSLSFRELKDAKYPSQNLTWDNEHYIFGKFRKFLKRWKKGKLKKKDKKNFSDIWSILDDKTIEELLLMLKTAFNLKWYGKENISSEHSY